MSSLIENAAMLAHEANILYCQTIGDFSQVRWEYAPKWQRDSVLAGVRAVINRATPEELHESWMMHKIADGWTRGDVKDPVAKTHPCLVEYYLLPEEQRAKDTLFRDVATAYLRAVGVIKEVIK